MTFSIRQLIAAVVVSFCIGALVAPVATHGGQAMRQEIWQVIDETTPRTGSLKQVPVSRG